MLTQNDRFGLFILIVLIEGRETALDGRLDAEEGAGSQTSPLPQNPAVWEDRGQSVIAVPRGGSGQLHPGCEVGNWGWQGEGACMGFFGEVMVACRGFQRGELGLGFGFCLFLLWENIHNIQFTVVIISKYTVQCH